MRQGLPQQYPPLAGVAVDGFTGCCEDAIPINCVGLSSLNSESCQHFVSVLPERRVGDEVDVDCRCQGKPCRKARADTLMSGSGLGGSVELGVICVEELHKGQSGSRRKRSTVQAAFAVGAVQEQHRSSGQELFACCVYFQQAYDTVPREQLWPKVHAASLGDKWLRALQALYADVPMAMRTAAEPQISNPGATAAAAVAGHWQQRRDLPLLLGSSSPAPPLQYADDMVEPAHGSSRPEAVLPAVGANSQPGERQAVAPLRARSKRYIRLAVRQSTPSALVLVEAGEQPLWLRWLRRAAKL